VPKAEPPVAKAPIAEPATPATASLVPAVSQAPESETWRLHEGTDNFTKTAWSYAGLVSSNTFEFGFPYQEKQHAVVFVRPHRYTDTHKVYYDISLKVERGQFLCGSDGCVVYFRFDDGIFDEWRGRPLKDGTTNEITLGWGDSFGSNDAGCLYLEFLRFKSLAVQAGFFREGTRMFVFNIEGLEKLNFPTAPPKDAKDCNERLAHLKKK
jgi:hypothetical protein